MRLNAAAARTGTSFLLDAAPARPIARPKPKSESWFTGKPTYNDVLKELASATKTVRQQLYDSRILEAFDAQPSTSMKTLGITQVAPARSWAKQEDVAKVVALKIRRSQYIKLVSRLNGLKTLLPAARLADRLGPPYSIGGGLVNTIESAVSPFYDRVSDEARSKVKSLGHVDEHGRAYAVGKRKASSARVWIIPVKEETADESGVKKIGEVLVNNRPLREALPFPSDRAAVLRPFTITQSLGRYNVFAIAKGGGSTGQTGAIQLGVAKCLTQLMGPFAKRQLNRAGLLRRDPRRVLRASQFIELLLTRAGKIPGKVKHNKANQYATGFVTYLTSADGYVRGAAICLTTAGQALIAIASSRSSRPCDDIVHLHIMRQTAPSRWLL